MICRLEPDRVSIYYRQTGSDLTRLRSYLLALDGRNPDGLIIDPDLLFRDRFE